MAKTHQFLLSLFVVVEQDNKRYLGVTMWSWHFFMGLQFGFEFYEAEKIDDSKNKTNYSYFIIDVGCLRIQKCEQIFNV